MTEILFATWDGGGNVPPAVGIAHELVGRGHRVRFLGHESQRTALVGEGFAFAAYAGSRPFVGTEANSVPRLIALFGDRQLGRDLLVELEQRPADVVVVDCMLLGVLEACQRAGQPHVSLEHLFDGYLRGGWARGPVGLVARVRGLPAGRLWSRADACLVASSPTLDPGHEPARRPEGARWTGPVLAIPARHDLEAHAPAVLVSLSTFHYAGMADVLQRILDATTGLGARVVATTGPVVDPATLRAGPDHEVHRFLPHDAVMPEVSLVVGHGGHATTMRALAHDLPLVVVPMHPLLDQPVVGRAVARAGAGAVLPRRASVEQLRASIAEHLAPGPHRVAAARLGEEIRGLDGTRRSADAVLALADRALAARPIPPTGHS